MQATVPFTPVELGLPPHFSSFREDPRGSGPSQYDRALDIAASDYRFSLVPDPPGTGKSLTYVTASKLKRSRRTLVLVGTKVLADQLAADFKSIGMADVRGRDNYRCPQHGTCGEPYRLEVACPYAESDRCTYRGAVAAANGATLVVGNYAHWLALAKYGDAGALGTFDMLILDEVHSAVDWLTDVCTVRLVRSDIKALLGIPMPNVDDPVNPVWADWASKAWAILGEKVAAVPRSEQRRRLKLLNLRRDVAEIAKAGIDGMANAWVARRADGGGAAVDICPVWPGQYAEALLFRDIGKVVLCSGTMPRRITQRLGIPTGEYEWHTPGTGFDSSRHPFIYLPTTTVDFKMSEAQKVRWAGAADLVIEAGIKYGYKGIVHTNSYAYARDLLARSKYHAAMLTHTTDSARATIEKFKRATGTPVLVSPSVAEGHDFPADLARYQIIAKLPLLDGRDPLTRARWAVDKQYKNDLVMQKVVQMYGRARRSEGDWARTVLIDDHWRWFMDAAEAPAWFKAAWRGSTREGIGALMAPQR